MKIIKNAKEIAKKIPRKASGPRTDHGKALLTLKSGEGFNTTMKRGSSLRVLAKKNNIKISVLSTGNGKCLVCRL